MGKVIKEYKTFHFEVKAVDDEKGLIEAYGSVFSNIDQGNDVVDAGSFKRTIKNSKARVDANKAAFLATMLWNHDTEHFLPIGGWYGLEEDEHGLLGKGKIIIETDLGRNVYTLIKEKVINEFSIGYEVMPGGAYYEKSTGVRHLTELRLWEISPVVFAMNQEALLVGVKSMDLEQKTVCGDTSLPIGPRDEAWDGSKAKKQIFEYAAKEDGTIDASKAKKCFLQMDGDTSLKGSYHYPFCVVDDGSPRINVGGVKACAGALAGGRGASTEGEDIAGMRRKVETLYKKINSKYPDATPLEATWDGKGNNRRMERKTFAEHYNDEVAQDLLEDWQDVYVCALTCAIFDAFTIGDQPESDISQALDDFKATVLSKFVAQGVECGLSDYLEDHGYSYTPGLNTMQNGSDGSNGYGYMSRSDRMDRKAGRSISAATQSVIDDHVKSVKAMAKKAKADMQAHTDAMHEAIDNMSGGGKSLGTPSFKVGRPMSADNADKMRDLTDKAMAIVQDHTKALHKAANGLANAVKPPVSDTDGEDPTDDEDQQTEKSLQDALKELKALAV